MPGELIDAVALVGPRERVRERLKLWQASPVDDAQHDRLRQRNAAGDGRAGGRDSLKMITRTLDPAREAAWQAQQQPVDIDGQEALAIGLIENWQVTRR